MKDCVYYLYYIGIACLCLLYTVVNLRVRICLETVRSQINLGTLFYIVVQISFLKVVNSQNCHYVILKILPMPRSSNRLC